MDGGYIYWRLELRELEITTLTYLGERDFSLIDGGKFTNIVLA